MGTADAVAGAAGGRTRPAPVRAGDQRDRDWAVRLAVDRAAGRLAARLPAGAGAPDEGRGRPAGHRGRAVGARLRADRAVPAGRADRHPVAARPADPSHRSAAAQRVGRVDRGTAPAGSGRDLRQGAGRCAAVEGQEEGRGGVTRHIVVHRNAESLAAATAARLVTKLVDVQAAKGSASLVLTGGGVGIATLEQLRRSPACDAVDWSNVDIYWGTSASSRQATRSATSCKPDRRCWTTCRSIPIAFIRCRRPTGRTGTTRKLRR